MLPMSAFDPLPTFHFRPKADIQPVMANGGYRPNSGRHLDHASQCPTYGLPQSLKNHSGAGDA